jgi:hypothetical protein
VNFRRRLVRFLFWRELKCMPTKKPISAVNRNCKAKACLANAVMIHAMRLMVMAKVVIDVAWTLGVKQKDRLMLKNSRLI